jgi:hypothetical protein
VLCLSGKMVFTSFFSIVLKDMSGKSSLPVGCPCTVPRQVPVPGWILDRHSSNSQLFQDAMYPNASTLHRYHQNRLLVIWQILQAAKKNFAAAKGFNICQNGLFHDALTRTNVFGLAF